MWGARGASETRRLWLGAFSFGRASPGWVRPLRIPIFEGVWAGRSRAQVSLSVERRPPRGCERRSSVTGLGFGSIWAAPLDAEGVSALENGCASRP
jgi:hypothetical protein